MMLDWNEYRKQLVTEVAEMAKLSADTVRGYVQLSGAGAKTGHLDAKTRCPPRPRAPLARQPAGIL